tara:strand:+ start:8425 stop:8559 length:135 start_codon:yes stop_codon:yes gene_type:complete
LVSDLTILDKALMGKGNKSADNYVEFFYEIYWQDLDESIVNYCE